MLRRLLITWIIVSILGYGMAVVADVHFESAIDRTHAIGDHTPDPIDLDGSPSCDHGCHGVIHLLGLKSAEVQGLITGSSMLSIPYSFSFTSFSPTLPFRPPIAV